MKKVIVLSFMLLMVLGTITTASAQTEEQKAEISSSVPALQDFHTIIFPLWHKAYPAKDTAALRRFVPQIKAKTETLNQARLPGILRDQEAQWNSELKKFNALTDNYYQACAGNDAEAMLKAAENLHRGYEALNRVVKPFVPEMEAYHQTLYIIYHKLYPKKEYKAIAALMDKLVGQADAVTKVPEDKISRRLKEAAPAYYSVSKELYDNTVALKDALLKKQSKSKEAAIMKLHSTYKKLEAVFE